jgi:serine/threonine-protein kinase
MGSVHLARDPQLNRQVALKLLHATLDTDEWRRRFQREAKALARLDHQNIVTIFDFGEDDRGRPYIVMEYVRGRHLGEMIGTPLPLVQKLALLEQLCSGLDLRIRRALRTSTSSRQSDRRYERPAADRGLRIARGLDIG